VKLAIAAAVTIACLCGPAKAQQGPWNMFAQREQSNTSAPHKDLRCGWWLMRKFGLSDRRLWKAYSWSSVGRPSNGSVGDVAVMKRSHVGYISGLCSGGVVLTSYGNSRIGVYSRCYPRSAFRAFRRL
jgi:hypothetical protein